jgi:deoxycytidylate deaminase
MAVHAEVNCIINSSHPQSIQVMVVTASPCFKCALVMANLVSLEAVYFAELYPDRRGVDVLSRAGKTMYLIIPEGELGYPLKRIA